MRSRQPRISARIKLPIIKYGKELRRASIARPSKNLPTCRRFLAAHGVRTSEARHGESRNLALFSAMGFLALSARSICRIRDRQKNGRFPDSGAVGLAAQNWRSTGNALPDRPQPSASLRLRASGPIASRCGEQVERKIGHIARHASTHRRHRQDSSASNFVNAATG